MESTLVRCSCFSSFTNMYMVVLIVHCLNFGTKYNRIFNPCSTYLTHIQNVIQWQNYLNCVACRLAQGRRVLNQIESKWIEKRAERYMKINVLAEIPSMLILYLLYFPLCIVSKRVYFVLLRFATIFLPD